jgi:hypothetical protein
MITLTRPPRAPAGFPGLLVVALARDANAAVHTRIARVAGVASIERTQRRMP